MTGGPQPRERRTRSNRKCMNRYEVDELREDGLPIVPSGRPDAVAMLDPGQWEPGEGG